MISLLTDLGAELLLFSPLYVVLGLMVYVFARLCVKWKAGRVLCGIVLLGLCAGLIYGLLRATGVILYPDDNSMSWNFYDTSFRTEGVKLVVPCGLGMAAVLAAGWSGTQTKVTQ